MKNSIHGPYLSRLIRDTIGEPRRGIEVGVERGRTTQVLMRDFPRLHLICIDPWAPSIEQTSRLFKWAQKIRPKLKDGSNLHKSTDHVFRSQETHDSILRAAKRVFRRHRSRLTIIRATSIEAAKKLREKVDFVFIDGDHTRCAGDIELFYPLVRTGGLLSGHDYGSKSSRRGLWDVNKAVDKFASESGLDLLLPGKNIWGFVKAGD